MTNPRTSKRGLRVVLYLAVALSNGALAQIPGYFLNLRTPSGGPGIFEAGEVGTPVSLVAEVSSGNCGQIQGGCQVPCSFPAGLVRLTVFGQAVQTNLDPIPANASFQCLAPAMLSRSFSVNGPTGTHTYSYDIAAGGNPVAVSTIGVQVRWTQRTSSTSPVDAGLKPLLLSDTPVTLRATVTGYAPSGRVDFKDGSRIVAFVEATNSSGVVGETLFEVTTHLSPGKYNLVAAYGGDVNNGPSSTTAPPLAVTVTISPAHAAALQVIIDSLLLDD